MKVYVQFLLLSVVLGYFSAAACADDLTPADEEVCDFLQGPEFSPGLFGLCNAYCEAKDCDEYGPLEDQPRSCQRLYDNFANKAMGPDDPLEPPCLDQAECPCWTTDDLADVGVLLPDPVALCAFDGNLDEVHSDRASYFDFTTFEAVFFENSGQGCEFTYTQNNGSSTGTGLVETTPDEAEACAVSLHGLFLQPEFGEILPPGNMDPHQNCGPL
jgi:hypothetical protein